MLMTKYIYTVHQCEDNHIHLVVTRVADGQQKYFYQATGDKKQMEYFMNSITDELAEGYFPKRKSAEGVDTWAFLGDNPGRKVVEERAREELVLYRLSH